MTTSPIGILTNGQAVDATASPLASGPGAPQASAEQRAAARQFEAIFLRQLLGRMERGGALSGNDRGGAVYRSMMVGALADAASEAGGIGLADLVLESMLRAAAPRPGVAEVSHGETVPPGAGPQGAFDEAAAASRAPGLPGSGGGSR